MKKPWVAFLLNFILAGAGIAYLGMWGWAAVNLAVTLGIGFVLAFRFPDAISVASTVIPVMNGVIAMQIAKQMNLKLESAPVAPTDFGAKP